MEAKTMHKKLTDTVAWLDREIETIEDLQAGKIARTGHADSVIGDFLGRFEELRDDLAETLRKIEDVNP